MDNLKLGMKKTFENFDMGLLHYFLGVGVEHKPSSLFIPKARTVGKFCCTSDAVLQTIPTLMDAGVKLSKNNHEEPVDPTLYRQLIGDLICLKLHT